MKKNYIFQKLSTSLPNRNFIITALLLFFAAGFSVDAQTIRYAKSGATGDGSSWQNAGGDLQLLINASDMNDQIWVAAGTYMPEEGQTFSMKEGVKIYGSFPDTGTPGMEDRSITNYMSTLQANGSNVIRNDGNGLSAAAVLDGFTITGSSYHFQGAIYNAYVSPTFTNLVITGNSASQFGGGMTNYTSSPIITNVLFHNNSAGSYGGAVSFEENSYAILTNVTITNNTASLGSGLFVYTGSSITIRNSVIWGNYNPNNYHDNVFTAFNTSAMIANSLVGESGGSNAWNGTGTDGGGNIDVNPLFNDASTFFSIGANSPAVDGGNGDFLNGSLTTDLIGNPRFSGINVDMGAQEFQAAPAQDLPIRYVMQGGTGDGSSWANASGNLQLMIVQSQVGNKIWVAAGTYTPGSGAFFMKEGVEIYGGFPATGNPDMAVRNWALNQTILEANGNNNIIRNNGNGLTIAAVLDGFILQVASASAIYNSGVSPKFSNLVIRNNITSSSGGAIYNVNASPEISNSVLHNNRAFTGGAIYNDASSPALINLTIAKNTGTNLNDVAGGGLMNVNNSNPLIRNTILWDNSAGGYYVNSINNNNSTPIFQNSIVQEIEPTDEWNTYNGTDGGGNLTGSPAFNDPLSGDFTTQPGSAATDAGNTAFLANAATTFDIAGSPRLYGTSIDIGAYEAGEVILLDVRYVREGGTGDGSTWANASGNLQSMINQSAVGNEVWVAEGTYTRTGTESFLMKDGVKIYGGFAATGTPSFAERSWKTYTTILSGDNSKSVIRNVGVTITRTAVLDGFTITGGSADSGAGIYNNGVSPSFTNLIIQNNTSSFAGAGMYNNNGAPRLYNVSIINNFSQTLAGAMYNSTAPVEIVQSLIANNTAVQSAGAMYNYDSNMQLINSVVANNNSYYHTGGFNGNGGIPEIKNSIIWGNKQGTNISNFASTNIQFRFYNSIVQGSGGSSSWNNNIGVNRGGNIDADPLFTNPADNDFTTLEGSPVLEAGRNSFYAQASALTDFGGNPRLLGATIDIGLYEITPPVYPLLPVRYVKTGGTGDGSSWANASGNLQLMIDQSVAGNQVWVAAGIYQRPATGQYFSLKEGVSVYGGFANSGNPAMADRNFATNVTILRGNGTGVLMNENSGLTNATTFDGFTLTGGSGENGSGIYNQYASPTLSNLIINYNTTSGNGAGIYNNESSPVVINTLIANNTASQRGGGVYNRNSAAQLINVTISKNDSSQSGDGIYTTGTSATQVKNSIIWDNPNSTSPSIAYSGAPIQFTHSVVQNSGGSENWNSSIGTDNGNNIALDPQFIGGGNFNLQNGSPAIDAGNPALFTSTTLTDVGGNPRTFGNTIDMGAFEEQGQTTSYSIRYVRAGGTGDGGTWSTASGNITQMIAQSVSGNQVWVAAGNYQSSAGYSISLKEGVSLYGGFPATGNPAMGDRNAAVNITTLTGNGSNVISNDNNAITNATVFDGFTVTGGQSATGAGIYNYNASPTISNVIIRNNQGENGAAIYNRNASPAITNVLTYGNTAGNGASGMYFDNSAAVLTNVTIAENSGSNRAVITESSTLQIRNTILFSNGNTAYETNDSNNTITNSIIDGVPASADWDSDYGNDGGNNLSADPMFLDPSNGNYNLQIGSAAINAGNTAFYTNAGATNDIAGNDRLYGSSIDIGAFEEQGAVSLYNIRYVKNGGTGDGGSWATASGSLQLMINQSVSGNQVWVAAGTYQPASGNYFTQKAGVSVFGGFPATGNPVMDDRDWAANTTTLQGNNNAVLYNNSTALTAETIIDGFTITGGNKGGIYAIGSAPTYKNLIISNNSSEMGAGVYVEEVAVLLFENITLSNNTAEYAGGGMALQNASVEIKNATISDNFSQGNGGGILANNVTLKITDAALTGNSGQEGGGMYVQSGSLELTNITANGNTGGGIFASVPLTNILKNVTANNNTGTGITVTGDASLSGAEASMLDFENIQVNGNNSQYTGGMSVNYYAGTIKNLTATGNYGQYGGGLSLQYSPIVLKSAVIGGNTATNGGGIFSFVSGFELINGTVANNEGHGIMTQISNPIIKNSIIWDNTNYGTISNFTDVNDPNTYTFYNSLVQGSGGSANWNADFDVDGGGNIDVDPMFMDGPTGVFTLQASSPAVNAGNTSLYPGAETDTDIAGNPRLFGNSIDLGAFEEPGIGSIYGIRYVKEGGTGDGGSWATASGNLQLMINQSAGGNQVWVAAGTYQAAVGKSFIMRPGVKIYGGFSAQGGESSIWERNRRINVATLLGNGASVVRNDNNGLDQSAWLDGFTITGGYSDGDGGGIYNNNVGPVLANLIIKNNTATGNGGGVANINATPFFRSNEIRGNSATLGGGIYNKDISVSIMTDIAIIDNVAQTGGGFYIQDGAYQAVNATIAGNTATTAAAVYIGTTSEGNKYFSMTRGIIWGNRNSDGSTAIITRNGGTAYFRGSIIEGSASGAGWNSSYGTDDAGNIASDPIFANAANGDYQLAEGSPGINFGSNAYYGNVLIEFPDAAGNPRSLGEGIDLGAYENQAISSQMIIRYVKQTATGTGDGRSWANASGNLELMINQSQNYHQVWVAEGTYQPSQGQPFRMRNGVSIYGGFPSTGTPTMTERNWEQNVTVMAASTREVISNSNLDNTAILDGFTITGANVTYSGGGMYNNSSSPTLSNLIFTGNTAREGAAMYNNTSAPVLTNVLIENNTATEFGGGMSNYQSPLVMNSVTIRNNTALYGGGMYSTYSDITMSNSAISYNSSTYEGGGMAAYGGNSTYTNVLVSHNTVNNFSGGISQREGSITLLNCNVVDNSSQTSQGGITFLSTSATINNSIIWGNSAPSSPTIEFYNGSLAISYSLVQGSGGGNNWNTSFGTNGGNNIDSNPAFADAANNNYQLLGSSPAINSANTAYYADAGTLTDLAGNPRLNGSAIDMGILENQAVNIDIRYVKTDGTGDGTSWENASGDLAQMLSDAMSGNQVWVAAGTYETNGVSFRMPNNVKIYGGFPNTGTPDMMARDWRTNVTTLSGANNDLVIDNYQISEGSVLDGFTIANGNGYYGAGIVNVNATPTFRNLVIENNVAVGGAGMNNSGSSPTLYNVIFRNNTAANFGGAMISSDGSSPVLYNVVIYGNEGPSAGICTTNNSKTTITNSTIVNNTGSEPALVSYNNGLNEVRNSIIWGNTNETGEPTNFYYQSNPTKFYNSIVQNSGGSANWNSEAVDGGGNLDSNPLLDGEFMAQAGSPVINAGNNTYYPSFAPLTDYAGNTRIFETTIDIGAYESQGGFTELDIRYVMADGTGDGSSWANASNNLQQMINESVSGNQVWVAAGAYQPATSTSFSMKNGVAIYGGFPTTGEPEMAQRNSATNVTTLLGNNGRVVNNANQSLTATAILDGFTVMGGVVQGKGAGIYNVSASPTLSNLIIKQNTTTGSDSNSAGAGITNISSSPIVTNVLITGNQSYEGAGMLNTTSSPVLTNVTIANNTAVYASGMLNESGAPQIRNSIIWGNINTNTDGNNQEIATSNSGPVFTNSNFNYIESGIYNFGEDGGGNTSADPLFLDAANGLFTPHLGGSAINSGNNAFFTDAAMATDLAGNPRLLGAIDMGAYENQDPSSLVDIRYVKVDGTGDGLTWATASNNLQLMISQSNPNNQVWVAAGTYQPVAGQAFTMKESVRIYGSFPATGDPVMDDRDFTENVTTLQGNGNAVVLNDNNSLTPLALLDGFTITGGSSAIGGGIVNNNSSPVLSNLVITGNTSQGNGGGINNTSVYTQYSNITLTNNTAAGDGGGMYNDYGDLEMTNIIVEGNTAQNGGGMANTADSYIALAGGRVTGNTATAQGGGIFSAESQTRLINALLTNNTANEGAGVFGVEGYSNFLNATIAGNTSTTGAALSGDMRIRMRNSIIWGNATTAGTISNIDAQNEDSDFSNSIIQGAFDGGSWNTTLGDNDGNNSGADPMFTDEATADYSLAGGSPATNAGSNTFYNNAFGTNITTDTDAAGNPRLYDGIIDIGAYENTVNISLYDIRYVKQGASGNGSSWENASGSLALMIGQSQAGNQVWVAGGDYQTGDSPFSMKEGVSIYGGFPAEGNPGLTERDWEEYASTLEATSLTSVISNDDNGLTAAAILDGFFIVYGDAEQGGGIYNNNVSPTLTNLFLYNNHAIQGGGIYNGYSSPIMSNVQIINNSAFLDAGAMLNMESTITATNVVFNSNYTQNGTGAISNINSNVELYNADITNNYGMSVGAMYNEQSNVRLVNATIADNGGNGAGGMANSESIIVVENSIIWGNFGSSIENASSDVSFASTLLEGSGGSAAWNSSFGTDNGGNIDTDPFFADYQGSQYTLQANSPALNAGNTALFPNAATTVDLLGNPRIYGSAVDMGAYENPGTTECSITTTWNGTEWSNGEPVSDDYMAIITGNFVSTGDITACSLFVTDTPTVTIQTGHNLYIKGVVNVEDGAIVTLENNAHLLQSTEANDNDNTGNIIVHRNSSLLYRQDYTMWSSPVEGMNLYNFSPNTVSTRFYWYNTATDFYETITGVGPNSEPYFLDAEGILIRMPNGAPEAGYVEGTTPIMFDGKFTGVPNNGFIWKNLSIDAQGFNAVGNPYPSPISISALFQENESRIEGAIYLWRKKNASTVQSAYCTVNAEGEFVGNGQVGSDDPQGIIQTGQGFIVKAIDAGWGGSEILFTNEMRSGSTAHDNSFFRMSNALPPQVESNRYWLNLANDAGQVAQMLVGYKSNATMGVDYGIDTKFINDSATGFNSLLNDEPYVIQGRSLPFNVNDVVPLQFKTPVAGSFTISIDHMDGFFAGAQDIYLRDKLTTAVHDLKASNYTFQTETGVFNERFEVIYTNTVLGNDKPVADSNSIILYQQENNIHINSGSATMANVKIYDIRGRLVYEKSDINASETVIGDLRAEEQMLIVQITTTENVVVSKKIVY